MVNRLATVIVGRPTFRAEMAEQLALDVLNAMREPTPEMVTAAIDVVIGSSGGDVDGAGEEEDDSWQTAFGAVEGPTHWAPLPPAPSATV